MRGELVERAPARSGVDWHPVRIVAVSVLVLIVVGAVLGGAVGYAMSWLVTTALGSLGR